MDSNSRRGREASNSRDLEMATDPSLEVRGFPIGDGISVEESINSLHRSWEPLSPTASPTTPSSSGVPDGTTLDHSDETRPLLSRHARQIEERRQAKQKKLTMVFGVTIPCILSIFSVILFLRLGFVLGQAGFYQTMLMVFVGYGVVVLTVLSISAIATSSTVEGGGVYFMISRALGPEFGGSVGVIFFVANIFASASYIIGFVEALGNNLGKNGTLLDHGGIPVDYWHNLAYGTGILLFCLFVCLVGASLFAKTSFIIFCLVMLSLLSVMFSFGFVKEREVHVPHTFMIHNNLSSKANYTGWRWNTFTSNLNSHYQEDYTNLGSILNFQNVFAIMFNGCTGIMAGANISGDLKNPSIAIPQGTLLACGITFVVYIFLFTFSAFTCTPELLLNNYNYLQYINALPEFITVGVFSATLSAALSNLIGASRVLQALAKDRLFSGILHPFTWTLGKKKEPIAAVVFSWAIVQATLFLGELNTIAPIVTMFFLVSYCVVNLACFALKLAAAPNFRPTFQVYARYTSALGALSCIVLMFFIDAAYAGVTMAVMVILFIYLLLRGPATPWGDVSQALIYHQVRKYLLRLDIRKSHVKFWRPEVLLMVSNPRSAYHMIEFANDMKKGGLYVLGHVITEPFGPNMAESYNDQLNTWLTFVSISKMKSFVELIPAPSIRAGTQTLLATAGLGGMKPNTLAMGFYTRDLPINTLETLHNRLLKRHKIIRSLLKDTSLEKYDSINSSLPPLRQSVDEQKLPVTEYVGMIKDAIVMKKNVCILRHFEYLERESKSRRYIDVWPLCVWQNDTFDTTFLLLLQLACVLRMKQGKSKAELRIFIVVETYPCGLSQLVIPVLCYSDNQGSERAILEELLKETRIGADVQIIASPAKQQQFSICTFSESYAAKTADTPGHRKGQYKEFNSFMQQHSTDASVIFTSLPSPPEDLYVAENYINELDTFTANLPPVVMVFGNMQVMSVNFS